MGLVWRVVWKPRNHRRVSQWSLDARQRFTFKRTTTRAVSKWTAESEIERPRFYRGFTAVGRTLADVKSLLTSYAGVDGRDRWNGFRKCTAGFREANADDLGRYVVSAEEKTAMRGLPVGDLI